MRSRFRHLEGRARDGEYAKIAGRGRSGLDARWSGWYARHEGFLTLP